jgi:hydrogenase expression/formation protein HypC
MGKVSFGGVVKEVCLEYVPEVVVGDYTLVHVGFAISIVDEKSAHESLKLFEEMGLLDEELNPSSGEATSRSSPEVRPRGDESPGLE